MKILIVIDTLGSGGAQKLKLELAQGLVKKGHSIDLFIYDSNYQFFEKDFINAGIKIHIAQRDSKGFSFNVLKELRSLIIKGKYEAIISSLHAPSIYAAMAIIGIKSPRLIVCEESSSLAPVPWIKKTLFYFSTLVADVVVANSFSETELMKKIPGRSKKIVTIWNGFDTESIPFSLKSHDIKKNIEKILVVGRVAYPKNGLNLMKAMSLFLEKNGWMPEVNWIGRRDTDKRSTKDVMSYKLQEQMDEFLKNNKDLSDNWNWLGNVDDVYIHYRNSDVLITPSLYEGLPVVICEAMLSGCFVIASNVCDHPLLMGDEERGLLCDPNSPESICEAIERLNDMDISERDKMIHHARGFAEKSFTIKKMTESYESLLIDNSNNLKEKELNV